MMKYIEPIGFMLHVKESDDHIYLVILTWKIAQCFVNINVP